MYYKIGGKCKQNILQTILFNTVNEMENKNLAVVLTLRKESL